ncbi:MAG: YncE family protein, partial [Phycisphaerae bacterium]
MFARFVHLALMLAGALAAAAGAAGQLVTSRSTDDYDRLRVGPLENGRIVVPTNQVLSPMGRQVDFAGRPVDVALSPDGHRLAVLNRSNVLLIDVETGEVTDTRELPDKGGGSFKGILFAPDGRRVYASSLRGTIGVFEIQSDGKLQPAAPIRLHRPERKED